jgi:glycosyltransferase involved in cell wall biosynthesis
MKIAFISYEYPPDTAFGGIATYVFQAATMLHRRGHHVEVFAGSPDRSGTVNEDGILVHRIQQTTTTARQDFSDQIAHCFSDRHATVQFDVVEGPENGAHARGAVAQVPDIPLVVKLHTPSFMVYEMNYIEPSHYLKLRRFLGAIRRGQRPQPFERWQYDVNSDFERLHTLQADEVTTPSSELGKHLTKMWGLDPTRVFHVPYPYIPSLELLNIPIYSQTQTITFMGRLEARKGVLDLARAIPIIRRAFPHARFRFVGQPCPTADPAMNMQQMIQRVIGRHQSAVEFTGAVPLSRIPDYLVQTDICVFPSLWENFPNVCLEAMAAARGIVGSQAGGMLDMLDHGRAGRLVAPRSPEQIAAAVLELLENPALRMQLGEIARDRIITEYNLNRIGYLQEESYQRAIACKRQTGLQPELAIV